jgi:hypothetical protein
MLPRVMSVRSVAAVILCAALLVSCGSDANTEDTQLAEAYIVVVDWVLAEPEFAVEVALDELAVVFVESLGPAEIDLDVQVKVISHFEDQADIRFIDSRHEALEETDGSPVRDGGLLLGLGGVPLDGSWDVRGEVYRTAESVVGYRFQIDRSGITPLLAQPPDRVEPEGLVADS